MLHLLETHGIEVLAGYYLLISILGTLPPLPDNATYWEKWLFGIANAICGNAKNVMASIGQQVTTSKVTTATLETIETKPKETL